MLKIFLSAPSAVAALARQLWEGVPAVSELELNVAFSEGTDAFHTKQPMPAEYETNKRLRAEFDAGFRYGKLSDNLDAADDGLEMGCEYLRATLERDFQQSNAEHTQAYPEHTGLGIEVVA